MTNEQREQLIAAAVDVRRHAYAKYSNFPVGAAVLTDSGEIFTGCNVENSSYGLTICAERVAMVCAVAAGFQKYTALAIVTDGAHPPCGGCRQFLSEFCDDVPILLIDAANLSRQDLQLRDLLPKSFRGSSKS